MAEYVPIFKPGQARTGTASATITGGQVVAVSGDGTIGPAGAASTGVIGVAGFDAASTDKVTYFSGGVQNCLASGGITAGSPVIAGAAGTVVASAAPPLGQKVGVALTTATDGNRVRVHFSA
jgi:hypothetical protein